MWLDVVWDEVWLNAQHLFVLLVVSCVLFVCGGLVGIDVCCLWCVIGFEVLMRYVLGCCYVVCF